ncbi:MAG: glycoside hydrolase family 3 N-terminal domain-containing protein [Bacteroidota bacterium]|nr:glycoside hydrolase family 3 N-terminal domain-containing protein [Bacteroidota bacterium]
MKTSMVRLFFILLVICHSFASSDEALRKKLGQLFIVGFTGPIVSDSVFADLAVQNIGGVILSYVNGNLVSPAQIQQLISEIRSVAMTPPFICADQEGGRVARLDARNGFTSTYSAYTLGMVFQSPDSTYAQAELMASWMKQCGFNLNLAPVVDVAAFPYTSGMYYERLYSTDPMVVTAHAQTFIDGFHNANIMTTLKHFPGAGKSTDLIPYRVLLDSTRVDMIMVGHNFIRQIDSVYLMSLSPAAVQGLLRDSLGYDGVVITDDLFQMSTTRYGYGKAARLALNAGDDILLYVGSIVNNCSLVRLIIDTLEAEVLQGRIAMARVNEAYKRIMRLKDLYKVTSTHAPLEAQHIAPDVFHLSQNYPNPFNPTTTIEYQIPKQSFVTLKIFDLLGREVATLVNEKKLTGNYFVQFNGRQLPSGVYFYRIQAGNFVETKKMLVVK